jgi:hypothetical protein
MPYAPQGATGIEEEEGEQEEEGEDGREINSFHNRPIYIAWVHHKIQGAAS